MAMAHGIDAKVVAEGQAIWDVKSVSIGEVKENFLAFCERIGLLTHGVLHTDVLLPHPKNRGGLVLNGNTRTAMARRSAGSVQTSWSCTAQ